MTWSPVGVAALLSFALLLSGCVGDDAPPAPAASPDLGDGADPDLQDRGDDTTAHVLSFAGDVVEETASFEGSYAPTDHGFPQGAILGPAGVPVDNVRLHDITDLVPADVPTRIHVEVEHSATQGQLGSFVRANNPAVWVYDQDPRPDGPVDVLIVRAADETVEVATFYGQLDPSAEVNYTLDVSVRADPAVFPAAIAYGVTLADGDFLEVEFDGATDAGAVWLWDGADTFLGRFDAEDGLVHYRVGANATAGEFVVFIAERNPDASLVVVRPAATSGGVAPVRVLTQVVVNLDPQAAAPGSETTLGYDVPVVPFQVGYGYFSSQVSLDPQASYGGPTGELDSWSAAGAQHGASGFFNTDMGVPAQEPGTYTLMYSDTHNMDMQLTAWYVTYGR